MKSKSELRMLLKKKRETILPEQKKELENAVLKHILSTAAFKEADCILLYAPRVGEINLMPLIQEASRAGKAVAFPLCDPQKQEMTFHTLLPNARLTPGAYGIPEPPSDAPEWICTNRTLCILPGLSFSPSGDRLGYGKGYYDRFLSTFPGVTMGAVFRTMMLKSIPAESHDRPVQLLATETGVHICAHFREKANTAEEPQEPVGNAVKKDASPTSEKTVAGAASTSAWKRTLQKVGKRLLRQLPEKQAEQKLQPSEKDARSDTVRPLHAPAILVLCVFALLLLMRPIESLLTNRDSELLVMILLQILIFIIPAILYCKWRGERFADRIRMRPIRLWHLWFCFCALAVMISGGMLFGILTGGIDSLSGKFTLYDTFAARINGGVGSMLSVLLAYAVLPAFGEELIFRSIVCSEYERYGVGVSVTVSALFFAMLHFSFPLMLSYLFLGAVLALVLYATRSFFAVFLLHLLYNAFCIFGQPYLSAFYIHAGSNEIFLFCLVVVFLLFSAFAAGEARKIYHAYAKKNLPSDYTTVLPIARLPKTLWRLLLSPAVLACVIIWLIMAILNLLD